MCKVHQFFTCTIVKMITLGSVSKNEYVELTRFVWMKEHEQWMVCELVSLYIHVKLFWALQYSRIKKTNKKKRIIIVLLFIVTINTEKLHE